MGAAYRVEYIDPIMFVRWLALPTPESVDAIVKHAADFARAQNKKPHYVTLVAESLPIPGAEGRGALKQLFTQGMAYLHCIHLVFEGSSIKATMQRTIVDAAQMFARLKGGTIYVHASGEAAIRAIMAEVQLAPDLLILKAKNAKIF